MNRLIVLAAELPPPTTVSGLVGLDADHGQPGRGDPDRRGEPPNQARAALLGHAADRWQCNRTSTLAAAGRLTRPRLNNDPETTLKG